MGDDGVVQGGSKRRVQMRAERRDGFTAERRQLFLDHLAGCSNVSQAAAAVGTTPTTINYHRRRDPGFAQACAEALEAGYVALEAMLLARAAGGGGCSGGGGTAGAAGDAGGYVPGPGADAVPGADSVDTNLAQFLLSLRAREMGQRTGKGRTRTVRVSEKELNASLLAKLKLLGAGLRSGSKRAGKRGAGKGAGKGVGKGAGRGSAA